MSGGLGGQQTSEAGQDVRALQIIGAALITGPAFFLGLAIFLRSDPEGAFAERPENPVLTWTALFAGLAVIATSLLLPRPKGRDIGTIRGHFVTRLAMVEGGVLFGTVAYLLDGELFSIGIALLCMAVMAALHFPTAERVDRLRAERP